MDSQGIEFFIIFNEQRNKYYFISAISARCTRGRKTEIERVRAETIKFEHELIL